MPALLKTLSQGSQAASLVLGAVVLAGAGAALMTSSDAAAVTQWSFDVLGVGFLCLLASLIFVATFALVRMSGSEPGDARYGFWLEVGVQAANGVSTLALTFTLLGISLGIGGLAGQELTPETVQPV
ncbi:MAG: hypothetical protein JKY20_11260, partial [Alphaproteobacteria bacterium]|nr:hypothetical protein [Alphaproteobacteria bacterium]